MPVLRVSDVPVGGGRRVEVAEFGYQADQAQAEQVRWYLEDYPEFPADPAPLLAAEAEARLARTGAELFGDVFAGPDGAVIWDLGRADPLQHRSPAGS